MITKISSEDPLFPDLRETWRHRALAMLLARRNVKVRFKQTLLGRGWLVLQPIMLSGVLALFLGALLDVPSDGIPYAAFVFSGTALWTMFQRAVSDTGMSLAGSGNLLTKVYFPRLLIPASAIITVFLDFLPVYVLVVAAAALYGRFPGWIILVSPAFVVAALALAFAIGLWVTIVDAIYRDTRLFVPYALQLGFYVSPVVYSSSIIPQHWQTVYALNPFSGIVEGFRWSVLAGASPPGHLAVAWALVVSALLLVGGLAVFARLERIAVDRI
jgi:lipopolysaccharide transport system permease protein